MLTTTSYHLSRYQTFSRLAEQEQEKLTNMSKDWTYSRWATKTKLERYRRIAQEHLDQYNQILIHEGIK